MASPEKKGATRADERLISRTYRAAIRIGEDFITLEETVTLPIDASDEEVEQAVDLGWRIYRAQRAAVESQVSGVRETAAAPQPIAIKDPDSPASDKQRNYIAALQDDLAWTAEQLAGYANDQQLDLVTMTKGQASAFIDGLKKLAEDRTSYGDNRAAPRQAEQPQRNGGATQANGANGAPANEKQLVALERIARQHGLDLAAETQQRYGVAPDRLSANQASALLREWQQRPAQQRRMPVESAL
jgi:hypothetical protein